jgi:site-specific DNA-methyltransferase (adenine-specific)
MKISEVYNEDCMLGMARYPDKFFDLAIVDPPYRDVNEPDQWLRANNGNMKEWQPAPNKNYFIELKRVSKEQIIWGGNYFTEFLEANNNWIIWHKLNEGVHFSMCEMAWSSIRKNIQLYKHLPPKDKIHPTQKLVQLYKWLLDKYAKPNDIILDTHMGSQSSRIAAYNMGFDYYGWELDKEYFEAGNKRFKEQTMQQQLFKQ